LHLDHLSAGISVIPNQIPEGADAGWVTNQSPDVNSSRAFRRISQSNSNKARRDRTPRLYLLIFSALTGLAQMAQILKGKPICNAERLRVTTQTKAARGQYSHYMSKRASCKKVAHLCSFFPFSTALYVEELSASPFPEVPDECCAKSECSQYMGRRGQGHGHSGPRTVWRKA